MKKFIFVLAIMVMAMSLPAQAYYNDEQAANVMFNIIEELANVDMYSITEEGINKIPDKKVFLEQLVSTYNTEFKTYTLRKDKDAEFMVQQLKDYLSDKGVLNKAIYPAEQYMMRPANATELKEFVLTNFSV